jgi:competence protein ComEC
LAGITISSITHIFQALTLGILIFGIFFITFFWQKKKMVVLGFCLIFLVLGIQKHQSVLSEIVFPGERDVVFEGIVVSEPDIRENNTNLIIESSEIYGKILLVTGSYPKYEYGDKLKISGKLTAPASFDEFDYGSYLAKDGIYSVIYRSEIEYLDRGNKNQIYSKILEIKNNLRKVIFKNLSSPQSSILSAMILGDRGAMSDQLKEKLNMAGLRHITAISGMHITIISLLLMQVLLSMGFWKNQAFYFSVSFLIFYVIMIGFPPSAVRAAIMAGSFLLARKI